MTYDYSKYTTLVETQIAKYGDTVYLHVPVDGKVNSGTGQTTYSQLTIPIKGIVTGFSTQDVNNVNVLENDKIVLTNSGQGQPLVNNTITVDDELFRILEVHEVNPGVNQPIIYKLHIRSTTLAPDLDGFITTLKGLELGDVVIDPDSPRGYPHWIKVADGHHASNTTTLVEKNPYYLQVYSLSAPYLNRWSQSDLYEWLNTVYLSRLSYNFNMLLKSVLIETQGYISYDKISLLSKEELDGTYIDSSSGKQIPYFSNQLRRIAVDAAGEGDNIQYWTRSYIQSSNRAVAVDELGNTSSSGYTITSANAVRAMVFLQEEQLVKLNDDGETYSLIY